MVGSRVWLTLTVTEPCGRELDGVGEEVEEDLAEADAIGVDFFGEAVGVVEGEGEGFFDGAGAEEVDGLLGDLRGGDGRRTCDGDFADFGAGEVEQVIDEGEEVAGVFLEDVEVFDAVVGGMASSAGGRRSRGCW